MLDADLDVEEAWAAEVERRQAEIGDCKLKRNWEQFLSCLDPKPLKIAETRSLSAPPSFVLEVDL